VRARPGTRTRDADGRSEATPASKTGVIYSKSSRVVQSPENVLKFCQRLLACFANKALLRASAKRSAERYANLQSPIS
jgi:hypothetical protein